MSEYQFYDFLALDRPLTRAEQAELRGISSRARITATRFTNHYNWGDLSRPPQEFMRRWFDLHLYFANWGTRCLSFRWPAKLVDAAALKALVEGLDFARIETHGEHVILDIACDPQDMAAPKDEDAEEEYEDDGDEEDEWAASDDEAEPDGESGRLPELIPLHEAVLEGDLRLFTLIWLLGVQHGQVRAATPEPVGGSGPPMPAMESFAEFLWLDADLLAAATEIGAQPAPIGAAIAAMPEAERIAHLTRIAAGEPHAVATLRRQVAAFPQADAGPGRTAGALRRRAAELRAAREAEAARQEAERKAMQAAAEARARRQWLEQLAARGDSVWAEIEAAIARRNASGYKEAVELLDGLRDLAREAGNDLAFTRRVTAIAERASRSPALLRRLDELGLR